ncbi:MAG: bacteriocin [Clostridiales bacterium]|nr:bacteriocin [Candidatus Coliplasma equi]
MKTKEELNALKNEVEALNKKLAELTKEELAQVTGGGLPAPNKRDFEPLGSEFAKPATNNGY